MGNIFSCLQSFITLDIRLPTEFTRVNSLLFYYILNEIHDSKTCMIHKIKIKPRKNSTYGEQSSIVLFCRKRQVLQGKLNPLCLSRICAFLLVPILCSLILSKSWICLLPLALFPQPDLQYHPSVYNVLTSFLTSVLFVSHLLS